MPPWSLPACSFLLQPSLGCPRLPALEGASSLGGLDLELDGPCVALSQSERHPEIKNPDPDHFPDLPGELRLNPCIFHSKAHSGQTGLRKVLYAHQGTTLPTLTSPAPGIPVPQPSLQQPPPG